jgi:hypothetical protein
MINFSMGEGSVETMIKKLWQWWKGVAQKIGNFQARVFLTLLYFLLLPVFALILKTLKDPLSRKKTKTESFWLHRQEPPPSLEDSRRQF